MTKNAALAIIAVILGAMVLMWVLKIAFKLMILGVVAVRALRVTTPPTMANRFLTRWSSSRSSSACCSASRRWSSISVLVPNQRTIWSLASRIGSARDRNQRYCPSAARRGKVSSHSLPSRKWRSNFSATRSM